MRYFKPKGIIIFDNAALGLRDFRFSYRCKSKGRTGAKVRSWFMRLAPELQQRVLYTWAMGNAWSIA